MRILLRPWYWCAALILSSLVFAGLCWLPLIDRAHAYLIDTALPLGTATALIAHLFAASLTDALTASPFFIVLSLAIGTNLPLLYYFARAYHPGLPLRSLPLSVLGFLASVMGIGCAACGAIFFGAFSASASGILLALPFQGAWIGYLGIVLLLGSSVYLIHEINQMK